MCLRCASPVDQGKKKNILNEFRDCAQRDALLIAASRQNPADSFPCIAADPVVQDLRKDSSTTCTAPPPCPYIP